MIYYCIADIHACKSAFEDALDLVLDHLSDPNTCLILLGDYVHRGEDGYGVIERIMALQEQYGYDKVIALLGNHDDMCISGYARIQQNAGYEYEEIDEEREDRCIQWLCNLPRYHVDGKTIFCHAGIDEEAEEEWEYGTDEYIFTEKYPAQTGHFFEDYKIVAGHVYTSEISGNPNFKGIFYDGESHYFLDANTPVTGVVNVLKVDTIRQEYYEVTPNGTFPILPYEE